MLKCDLTPHGYDNFSEYMKTSEIKNFKVNPVFNEILEHIGTQSQEFGLKWYKKIIEIDLLSTENILHLINLNDRYGGTTTYKISSDIPNCSPNTLKYIYYALLTVIHIKITGIDNFDFVEVGGGYGGQCLIIQEVFKILNININKYILIDLPNVVQFQEKYITANGLVEKCVFLTSENYHNYKFNDNSYLFSCYSLSEVYITIRHNYFKNILPHIVHGFIVWNNSTLDIPVKYTFEIEYPLTGTYNKFLYF
jgi:hypothetical protein